MSACGIIDQAFYKEIATLIGQEGIDITAGINQGASVIVSPRSAIISGPFEEFYMPFWICFDVFILGLYIHQAKSYTLTKAFK